MSRWKEFKTAERTLKATLTPPPTTVLITSRTANNPLNVLVNFLAVSSLGIREVVILWNAAIASKIESARIGSKVPLHAFPMDVNTCAIALPIFLNEFISNQRPLISSRLSIKSSKGMPSFSATSRSSLRALICSSVYPLDLSCSSDSFARVFI